MGKLIDITGILKSRKFRHENTKLQIEICHLVARTGDFNGESDEVRKLIEKRDALEAQRHKIRQSLTKATIKPKM